MSLHVMMDMHMRTCDSLKALLDLCQNRVNAFENVWKSMVEPNFYAKQQITKHVVPHSQSLEQSLGLHLTV